MDKENINIDFETLVGKYLSGSAVPEEEKLLESFVKSDEQKKLIFIEIKKSWSLARSSKYRFDTEAAWQQVKMKTISKDEKTKPLFSAISYGKKMLAVAATILLLILGAYFIYDFIQYSEKTLISDLKPIKQVLSDGTKVSLNANSTLKYPANFKGKERRVILDGEAFFEVKPVDDMTFIVEAHEVEIHVLGTSFYVSARKHKDVIEVTVFSGKVLMITPDGHEFEINAGEQKTFNKVEQIVFAEETIDPNTLSWKTKLIIFENTSLGYVFEVISNTYHIDIAIKQDELKNCKLTATFDDRPLEDILEIIMKTFDLRYLRSGDKIWVSGEECK